ncbi:MAG: hypothetical protein WAK26_07285, partial [Terracidiphilus sp.]
SQKCCGHIRILHGNAVDSKYGFAPAPVQHHQSPMRVQGGNQTFNACSSDRARRSCAFPLPETYMGPPGNQMDDYGRKFLETNYSTTGKVRFL